MLSLQGAPGLKEQAPSLEAKAVHLEKIRDAESG